MYKLICCDIDGTLLDDKKRIPSRNSVAIKKALDMGVIFSLVSGRMPSGTYRFLKEMNISGPISCYNGCAVYDENLRLVHEDRMDQTLVSKVLDAVEETGLSAVLFNGDQWFVESRESYVFKEKLPLYQSYPVIGSLREANRQFGSNKILIMSPDPLKFIKLDENVRNRGLNETNTTFYSNKDFYELMPANKNKGIAISVLADILHIDKKDILAIGDDYNDLEMLQEAGCGVAMKNSVPEVFEVADEIVCSNNDGGVGEAIERFILKN